jgi:hypothetical protein
MCIIKESIQNIHPPYFYVHRMLTNAPRQFLPSSPSPPQVLPITPPALLIQISKLQYRRLKHEESESSLQMKDMSFDLGIGRDSILQSEQHAEDGSGICSSNADRPVLVAEDRAGMIAVDGTITEPGSAGHADVERGQACYVCMNAEADAVLIECGHGGLCAGNHFLPIA